jgi:hypothetical protein
MRGGKIIGQGQDTCVIAPAKPCPGVPVNSNQVSRLVDPTSRDAETEKFILKYFSFLVNEGFIASSVAQCNLQSSQLVGNDLSGNATHNGCISAKQRQSHINLITNRFDGTAQNIMVLGRDVQKRELISTTAVITNGLVPDNGPWIIETDLHYNNIGFTKRKLSNGYTATIGCIADWGRALYITNPKDFNEVRKGIERWCSDMIQKGFGSTTEEILNLYADNSSFNLPQHRNAHMKIIRDGYKKGSTVQQKQACINAIRGWMMHSVLSADRLDMSLLVNNTQYDQAKAGAKRYPGLNEAHIVITSLLYKQPLPTDTPSLGQVDPAAPAKGLPKEDGIIVVPGADIAIPAQPARINHKRKNDNNYEQPEIETPPKPQKLGFMSDYKRLYLPGEEIPQQAPMGFAQQQPYGVGFNPYQKRGFGTDMNKLMRFGGQKHSRSSIHGHRLPSLPTRRARRSSSSKKKRYSRRRLTLRTGKGGYQPTMTDHTI